MYAITSAQMSIVQHALRNAFFKAQEDMQLCEKNIKETQMLVETAEDMEEHKGAVRANSLWHGLYEMHEGYARQFERCQADLEELEHDFTLDSHEVFPPRSH